MNRTQTKDEYLVPSYIRMASSIKEREKTCEMHHREGFLKTIDGTPLHVSKHIKSKRNHGAAGNNQVYCVISLGFQI